MVSHSTTEWEAFLHSSAICYPRCSHSNQNTPYWSSDLLKKWQEIFPTNDSSNDSVSNINYASLILLASYASNILRKQLPHDKNNGADKDGVRIGLAIPEGPFLPLFVLAIHALNVAEHEPLVNPNVNDNNIKCRDVVLIPMETDEAPARLKHILDDSVPDLILVGPGKDMESLVSIMDGNSPIQLVDYISIVREALLLIEQDGTIDEILERLFPSSLRVSMVDSLRYEHAIPGSWDVARLVAWGCSRLNADVNDIRDEQIDVAANCNNLRDSTIDRDVVSHIVYTSGTTGKPKGCVSSLQSLQHYIRAKNKAHDIQRGKSRVLLASAITFDPCLSDVLATFVSNATLVIAPRDRLYGHSDGEDLLDESDHYHGLTRLLRQLQVTHVLCTPTLWATVEGDPPNNVPSLQVIALGGEPIPKAMRARWARRQSSTNNFIDDYDRAYPRLLATYGVTEACVYQTCGEVLQSNNGMASEGGKSQGQSVGQPLIGTKCYICRPLTDDDELNASPSLEILAQNEDEADPLVGEVVLSGAQVDGLSSYLNLPQLTSQVFVKSNGLFFYRTGDLGYIDATTQHLHILGRIKGDGMVKVNGVRIELAEIESALIDDVTDERGLVVDCMATATTAAASLDDSVNMDSKQKQLLAFCIVSSICQAELRVDSDQLRTGIIVQHGPLLGVLRARCDRSVRKGCTPSFFVIIDRLPLSPTGKRDRSRLPSLETCTLMSRGDNESDQCLSTFGNVGAVVSEKICECLNLQHCQRELVTRGSNFFALGGDSLAATRVCRGLYALHHGIVNSRNIGGQTGTLDGPFSAKYLLQSPTLGDYVDFLQSNSAFEKHHQQQTSPDNNNSHSDNSPEPTPRDVPRDMQYDYLLEAISLGHTCIASSLLNLGVNPNSNSMDRKLRLGKVKDRKKQRTLFHANPLHLACARGEPFLVSKLLAAGCKSNTPDAQGSFPIHLACSGMEDANAASNKQHNAISANEDDLNRLECVKMLLETTPISIKDGNKQTILHSAARSGHCELLKYIMIQWKVAADTIGIKFKSHNNEPDKIFDWYDRWFRTPVHWAVLNQRVDALRILLDGGCSASPAKPRAGVSKRSTNVIIETPVEMCQRLYGDSDENGREIKCLLTAGT